MTKEWIINNLEQDWDDENIYFEVTIDGKIKKYDLITDQTFEYSIERVEN